MAEVLITLAIIGVVAVLAIPQLVQSYKKKVTAVRLEHFAATWRQGFRLSQVENGTEFEPLAAVTPENTVEFYKKYYMPYIKTVSVEPSTCGIVASFPNGSGIYMYARSDLINTTPAYIYFCPHYKDCKTLSVPCWAGNEIYVPAGTGVKAFSFYAGGGGTPQYQVVGAERSVLRERCKQYAGYCSTLIERDGWTIKDDYPHKF